jgi:hypothetical protein
MPACPTWRVALPATAALVLFLCPNAAVADTATLAPTPDITVAKATPATADSASVAIHADGDPTKRAYLRFDARSVTGTVSKATLRLYVTNATPNGPITYAANPSGITNSTTWKSQPGPSGSALSNLGSVNVNAYVSINVTSLVASDSDHIIGLALLPDGPDGFAASSREAAANHPQLVVETTTTTTPPPPTSSCSFASAVQVGSIGWNISASGTMELSGVAASRRNPGVYWTHNDSGDMQRVFSMTEGGKVLGEYRVSTSKQRDWEDIAVGPGPTSGTNYVYVGDIGGNGGLAKPRVFRFAEPSVSTTQSKVTKTLSGVQALNFVYPGGSTHNAETLMVDPLTGDIYIVTKHGADGVSIVYRAAYPQSTSTTNALTEVARFTATGSIDSQRATTGGDISADGTKIIVRTYSTAYVWNRPFGTSVGSAMSGSRCNTFQLHSEPQGEAVGFKTNGDLLTLSEGNAHPIWRYAAQ